MVTSFVQNISQGKDVREELKNPKIPNHVQTFVRNTLEALDKPTCYVASQFFYGREDPIPDMFQRFIANIEKDHECSLMKYYLQRHIDIDGDEHGPLAEKLLNELAAEQDPSYELILEGAINATSHRIRLWDGICDSLQKE